jgi:hypothetical protein
MRTLSAAAVDAIAKKQGGEPLNIVQINWTQGHIGFYADRTITEFNIEGKILQLGQIENVVNVSKNTNSQSVALLLDDDDLRLKAIYNVVDIHKRPVKIWQWFSGLHFTDRFLIFEGEISSPIVWKESDRTLSFDVVSKIEDKEIGYSPEEGAFDLIPDDMLGKAWPLPFGTVIRVPSLRMDNIPAGATLDSNLIEDFSIHKQQSELNLKILELGALASLAFNTALLMYYNSHIDGNGGFNLERVDQQYESLGDQYTEQGNQFLAEQWQAQQDLANLGSELARQGKFKKNSLRVNGGECFPQGQTMSADIGGAKHTGVMAGNNFQISSAEHPGAPKDTHEPGQQFTTVPLQGTIAVGGSQTVIQKADFFWIPAGKVLKLISDAPIRYILAMLPVSVLNVWAKKNYGDTRIMSQVPTNFYSVSTASFGSVVATMITFSRPLSHQEEGWDDEIFVDMVSPIGPNTVDILTWLITTYTSLGIDAASFAQVRATLAGFPSNFCLFDRKNIVQVLQEIAYQARCAIWLKNDVFYLRFLPTQPTFVDTITLDDVLLDSLSIEHTSTEELTTKLVASFKTSYDEEKPFKFILRNNVPKYGTHQKETDWYSYTDTNAVDIAATFWLIRESNTWKVVKFKTPIHKMRLETFDPVRLAFQKNWALNGNVIGIIQACQLDTDTLTCTFEVWIPVRIGEMHQFNFAFPPDSTVLVYPQDLLLAGSGGPGEQTSGDIAPTNNQCNRRVIFEKSPKRQRAHFGNEFPGLSIYKTGGGTAIVQPSVGATDNTARPSSDYQYRQYSTNASSLGDAAKPGVVPGKIVSGDGPSYKIDMYPKGLDGATQQISAKIVDKKVKPQPGDWVLVITMVFTDGSGPTVTNGTRTNSAPNKIERVFVPLSGKPGVYAGKVTGGAGTSYTVDLYKDGLSGEVTSVDNVLQLQIAGSDSVPANTWALIGETKNEQGLPGYIMQVPVWVE